MTTLYGKGDRVRVRSITSEMTALVVEGTGDVPPETVYRGGKLRTVWPVVVRPIYCVGTSEEKLGPPRKVERVIRREVTR